jgi:excisionase family DNA binding protein
MSGSNNPLATPVYLDKKQAAEIVSLNPKTIERLVHRGELSGFRLAGKIRIRQADLYAWIESQRVAGPTIHNI